MVGFHFDEGNDAQLFKALDDFHIFNEASWMVWISKFMDNRLGINYTGSRSRGKVVNTCVAVVDLSLIHI